MLAIWRSDGGEDNVRGTGGGRLRRAGRCFEALRGVGF